MDNIKSKISGFFCALIAYVKKAWLELTILFGVLLLDQISKTIVASTMNVGESVTVIPNLLNIYYTINEYAAMGSFFGLEDILGTNTITILLLIITFIATIGFCVAIYFFRNEKFLARLSFALIISGAIGNFIDRFVLGGVRDFVQIVFLGFDVPIIGTSFYIFNIADVALCAGVVMFAIYFLCMYGVDKTVVKQDDKAESSDESEDLENAEIAETVEKVESVEDTKADANADVVKNKSQKDGK